MSITDAAGQVTSFTYDAFGRATRFGLLSCTVRGNVRSSFDASGSQLTFTDELGHISNYAYDAQAIRGLEHHIIYPAGW